MTTPTMPTIHDQASYVATLASYRLEPGTADHARLSELLASFAADAIRDLELIGSDRELPPPSGLVSDLTEALQQQFTAELVSHYYLATKRHLEHVKFSRMTDEEIADRLRALMGERLRVEDIGNLDGDREGYTLRQSTARQQELDEEINAVLEPFDERKRHDLLVLAMGEIDDYLRRESGADTVARPN